MRVLMVSKACVVGAYQTKLEALARRPEMELTVIVPPYWKGEDGISRLERAYVSGYELIVSPIRFNGAFHVHYYPHLGHWLSRLRPDILHFDEEPYNLATYLGLRAAQPLGIRSLFFTWQNLLRRYPWPFRYFERACFHWARYAIAGNQDAAGVLRQKGYHGPLEVIPQFGVVPAHYAPASPPWDEGATLRIGYAGRLVPEKGVHVLLSALAGLQGDWRALIAGGGPEERALKMQAERLGIAGQVEFLGKMASTQMPAFFQQINVFVLPSISRPNWIEQFGRVLIEAMAARVAVVGSTCGEIPRVIGEAGLVFPEGDASALRHCLERLRDPKLRGELAQAGRQRTLEQFTQDRIAQRTYETYLAMMEESGHQATGSNTSEGTLPTANPVLLANDKRGERFELRALSAGAFLWYNRREEEALPHGRCFGTLDSRWVERPVAIARPELP